VHTRAPGSNLLSMDIGTEQDPYVKVSVTVDGVECSRGVTSVVAKGGRNPVWIIGNVVPLR
jgi:hypothetical protein